MGKNQQKRTRVVNLFITPNALTSIFKRLKGDRSEYDLTGIIQLRQLLSNEKAKILNTIKTQSPESIYKLAKILGRDFKAVNQDIKLLEKFGLVELKPETKGKRKKLRPIIAIDNLQININFQ